MPSPGMAAILYVRIGLGEHSFPGILVVSNAEAIGGADEWKAQEFGIAFDAREEFGIGELHVFKPGIDVGFAVGVEKSG